MARWSSAMHAPCGTDQLVSEPIFVVGTSHSGTSLMKQLLAAHPEIYDVAPRGDGESNLWVRHAADALYLWRTTTAWAQRCLEKRRRTWVEKTPAHVLHIDGIRSRFPRARFVVMTRDPRDTLASLIRRYERWERARGVPRNRTVATWRRYVSRYGAASTCTRFPPT